MPPTIETVMTKGMRITATTKTGSLRVTAGPGHQRSYTWESGTRSVEMLERTERWNGSLGLYFPGPGEHWKEHNGISRGVLQEGQQHFRTEAEALKWIRDQEKWLPLVYTNRGLVVGWRKYPSRKQMNVEVWQIYVNGDKPTSLPGASNEKIVVETEE